jgi:hypothetical protein
MMRCVNRAGHVRSSPATSPLPTCCNAIRNVSSPINNMIARQGSIPAGRLRRRRVTVTDKLLVNPAQLHRGSDRTFSAMHDAAVSFAGCENDVAEAMPGWVGESQHALADLAASWQDQHAAHQSRLTSLCHNMTEAAFCYAAADGQLGLSVRAVQN